MNFEVFRRTGELSDLIVIVDKTEFQLHTFPLFTKSEFFKKRIAAANKTTPLVIELEPNFPGGVEIFNLVADYLYSIPIAIEEKNIVPLRLAARLIECEPLATLVDHQLDEILLLARAKTELTVPLTFLEQCVAQQTLAKETPIVEKCLECLVECLTHGAGLQLTKSDRESVVHFPLNWLVQLIELCPNESKLGILPLVKHYLTIRVLDGNSTDDENEKRTMINELVKALGNEFEQLPLVWLNSLYEKSLELKCECEPTLSLFLTEALLTSTDLDDGLEKIPNDVMTRLIERVNRHKDEHIKDPQLLAKLTTWTDTYVDQLRQRGELTSEQFVQLASCVPKDQRTSHDALLRALDEILKDEKSTQLSSQEREELLNQIDFSRVSEETIAACKTNQLIPQQLITDAALSLCTQLRLQLDETQSRLRLIESQLAKGTRSSTRYQTRPAETSFRLPSRSRSIYTSNYDYLRSPSYSRYDADVDFDVLLPSRYISSASTSRYGGLYSTYRY